MLKKLITIIIILLVITAIVLGGAWFFARKQAVKNGSEAPSFKEFVSLGDRGGKTGTVDDGLSSDFTPPDGNAGPQTPGDGPGGPDGGEGNEGITDVSQFTNDTITPNTGSFSGSTGSMGTGVTSPNSSVSGSGSGVVSVPGTPPSSTPSPVITPPTGSATVTTGVECSEADVNITFTQAELDKLDALQRRFDAIAGLLHSDEDVENMKAIYDALILKEQNIMELTNYCEAKTPLLADPILKRKVPTPFWRNSQAGELYIGTVVPTSIDVGNVLPSGRAALERILRINFW